MKSWSTILALPIALSMMACGSQKSAELVQSADNSSIISGTSVSKDDTIAQSTVGLIMQTASGNQSTCSGTLIDAHVVLTAAHCVAMGDSNDPIQIAIVVFATSFDEITAENARGVVEVTVNPEFMPKDVGQGVWNDVALFKFEGDIPATHKVVPYLKDTSKLKAGMKMTIAGFGMTNAAGGEAKPEEAGGGTLLKADVVLKSPAFEGGELLSDHKESSSASTCKGDSGGPAYIEIDGQLTVVGVTSRGSSLRCDDVSIFSSTAFQAYFLLEALKALNTPQPEEPAQPEQPVQPK